MSDQRPINFILSRPGLLAISLLLDAKARGDIVPDGMLAPDDSFGGSGLNPAAFMTFVRSGRVPQRLTGSPGLWKFWP
jgi:hypothetical protein